MPTLDDYEYQFGDGAYSVKLNKWNPDPGESFWDVEKVQGLDMPPFQQIIQDVDGTHGADVFARYLGPRTIIIDGTLYAFGDMEDQIDLMKDSLIDVDGFAPRNFYFKHPGKDQRYCAGKAIGFDFDIDTGRRTNRCKYQVRIICEDPITYIDNTDLVMVSGVSQSLINVGNIDTFIRIVINGGTLSGTTTITDVTNSKDISFALDMVDGDKIEVDTGKHRIQKNDVDHTDALIDDDWFLNLSHGEAQDISVTWTGTADVTVQHKSGWW